MTASEKDANPFSHSASYRSHFLLTLHPITPTQNNGIGFSLPPRYCFLPCELSHPIPVQLSFPSQRRLPGWGTRTGCSLGFLRLCWLGSGARAWAGRGWTRLGWASCDRAQHGPPLVAFIKKGNDKNVYNRGYGIYVAIKENLDGWCNFCMSNLHKQSHMTLHVTFGLDPTPI